MDISKKLSRLLAMAEGGTEEEKEIAKAKIEELKGIYKVEIREEERYGKVFLRQTQPEEDGLEDAYINALMIDVYGLKLVVLGNGLYLFGKRNMLSLGKDIYSDLYKDMFLKWVECMSLYKNGSRLAKNSFYNGIISGLKDRLKNTNLALESLGIIKVDVDLELERNFARIFKILNKAKPDMNLDIKFYKKGLKESQSIAI